MIVADTTLKESAQRLTDLANQFMDSARKAEQARDFAIDRVVSYSDFCTRLVHVDSVKTAVDIFAETARTVSAVDSVSVWIQRDEHINSVLNTGAFSSQKMLPFSSFSTDSFSLSLLEETIAGRVEGLFDYFPVPIYHPGNGVVGLAEFGSKVEEIDPVSRRILKGLTDTAATVIGRLTVCERLTRLSQKFEALSKATSDALVIFLDNDFFAYNDRFGTFFGAECNDRGLFLEILTSIAGKGAGYKGTVNISGRDFCVRNCEIALGDKKAIAVSMRPKDGEEKCQSLSSG